MEALFAHVTTSPAVAALVLLIVFAASVVQFGLGMGFGLTAAPLLALIDPMLVPAPALFIGLVTSSWGAWRERGAIRWAEVAPAAFGRIVGVALSAAILSLAITRETFSLLFGLFVGLAVLLSVTGWRLAFTRRNIVAMATVSGLMGTITSVGAPPLAIVYQGQPAHKARPTLAAFFAIGCAISLAGLFATGWATVRDAGLAVLMLPGVLAGAVVAGRIGTRLDRRYRPMLLSVAGIASGLLILRGLA
ncbi:sulfite exporter TauE/SafE family protein [Defluviimonas sp. SAOS-178_SWC]|uniref:sulfite exporter TauE/SafE family protein n=1 Tax=Defluviimonas sp. SAOS-178_SWC TaxID=3121287 RepID=UPI0032220601